MKYEKCNSGLLLPTLSESNRMKASKPEFRKKLIGSKSCKSTAEHERGTRFSNSSVNVQQMHEMQNISSRCMKQNQA